VLADDRALDEYRADTLRRLDAFENAVQHAALCADGISQAQACTHARTGGA